MKKTKRAAAFFSAFMLAFPTLYSYESVPVYSAEQSLLSEAYICIPEGTMASNGMFTITFNTDNIIVTEVSAGEMLDGILKSSYIKDGKVTFAFVSTKPIDISGNILKIIYDSNGSSEDFSLKVNELFSIDDAGNEFSVDTENISVVTDDSEAGSSAEFSIELSGNSSVPSHTVSARVYMPVGTEVTNGVISLVYDSDKLRITEMSYGGTLCKAMTDSYEAQSGNLKIVFISNEPLNESGWIDFKFAGKADDTVKIEMKADEFFSSDSAGNISAIPVNKASVSFAVTDKDNTALYDLDEDGIVSAADLVLVKKCILASESVSSVIYQRADLNGNGTVDVFDVMRMSAMIIKSV